MKKAVLFAGAALLAATVSGSVFAQQPAPMNKADKARMANEANGPDNAFIVKAANSNTFEIESSKIAVARSKNAEVKKFAQQMITDHTKAGSELKAAAGAKVPANPDPATFARIEKIKAAKDDAFDAAYIDEQKTAHDEAVGLFTNFTKSGGDPKLKAFAEKTLPTLKMHQDHVKHLNASK
jgi:putative membrane protein